MAEITMKSTKAEIMEAYKAAVEKLDTRDRMIDDPAKEAAKAKKVEVIDLQIKQLKKIFLIQRLLRNTMILQKLLKLKQLELDELYGIETKANAMAAMINAYKEKNEELKRGSGSEKKQRLKLNFIAVIREWRKLSNFQSGWAFIKLELRHVLD